MSGPFRGTALTNQAAYDEVQKILAMLPDEDARKVVLWALTLDRCKTCMTYDPSGSCGCPYGPRGG